MTVRPNHVLKGSDPWARQLDVKSEFCGGSLGTMGPGYQNAGANEFLRLDICENRTYHIRWWRAISSPTPIHSESQDRFYFDQDHMSTLEFIRDETGAVSGHVFRRAFTRDTAWLVAGAEADTLLYGGTLVSPDPVILARYTRRFKGRVAHPAPVGFVHPFTSIYKHNQPVPS